MSARWRLRRKTDVTRDADTSRGVDSKNLPDKGFFGSGNGSRGFIRRLFHNRLALVVASVLAVLVVGLIVALLLQRQADGPDPKDVNVSPGQGTSTMESLRRQNEEDLAKAPTIEGQLAEVEKELSTAESTKDSGKLFGQYSEAALLAARLDKPAAAGYAGEALEQVGDDAYTKSYSKGLIDKLTAISRGDYSVAQ